jgi:RNA polymerase sigma factor (sigma-70 family)
VAAAQTPNFRGDEERLFVALADQLVRTVRAIVHGSDAMIEDACSFAWLQLVRCQPDRETVFPWLTKVAVREAWRLSRRERREAHLEDLGLEPASPEGSTIERALDAHEALTLLAALPESQRRYLTLLVAGYRYAEITQLLGVTHTNVNKHLVRARASLRQQRINRR